MIYMERLKELKERKGLTQNQIAAFLNITRGQYCHYETESEIMPLKYLIALCDYFKVSVDYIFLFTETVLYKNYKKELDQELSGQRLKIIRKEQKITQDKLAQMINVARSLISKYEKGEFLVSTHALYTICKKFCVSADYLLGKIDEPKYFKKH